MISDHDIDTIIAPIYAEMEAQKPIERQYYLQVMSDDYGLHIGGPHCNFDSLYDEYHNFDAREYFGHRFRWLQGVRIKAAHNDTCALIDPNGRISPDDLNEIGITESEYQRARPRRHFLGVMRRRYQGYSPD